MSPRAHDRVLVGGCLVWHSCFGRVSLHLARTLARVGKFQELRSRKIPLKSKRFFSLRGYRAGSRLLFGRILLGGPPQREGVALLRPVSSPHLSTTDEGFLRRHSGWQDWRRTFERTGLLLRTWAGWRAGRRAGFLSTWVASISSTEGSVSNSSSLAR